MSGSRCRSENQVTPVLTNDTVYSPMPERSTNGWQRSTSDRRRHTFESDSFPVHGDGYHLSRYWAAYPDGKVTPDIKAILRTGTPKGKVTPSTRALFRL
ncbi:uncharacterized protein LOC123523323 isoform X2 [Mercenaria mercenaria]|uniref:uncharacterized protein LOC123523323 isoform X2 n=1 Tax=Mercenaria mercenaria TaxID=6596 RepID=UPI00234E55A8|nr:uncharacterized protein LOC123523323 isoform X2 [Mercenaria mercenaria]